MTTIGESISRIRNLVKAAKQDAFMTDRFIYSLIVKYAKLYIKRQDNLNIRLKFASLFRSLPCVELIETNKIEACCGSLPNSCKIMRTKEKIPLPFEGSYGPFIRTVSSVDGSTEVYRTQPAAFVSMTKTTTFKYNKQKYYWYMNGYLYLPNADWDAIRMELVLEDNVVNCDPATECTLRQEQSFNLPEYLFSEAEQYAIKELTMTLSVPTDGADDGQNAFR